MKLESLAAWLADREIWPTMAGVALATLSVRGASGRWAPGPWPAWGLALLAGTWLVRRLGRGRFTVRTPVDGAALLLLLTVPPALWAATDRAVALAWLARLLAGLALAYGLANWASPAARRKPKTSLPAAVEGASLSSTVGGASLSSTVGGASQCPGLPTHARSRLTWLALGLSALGLGLALYSLVGVTAPSPGKVPYVPGDVFEQVPLEVEDAVNANMMAGALVTLLPYPLALALAAGRLPPLSGAGRRTGRTANRRPLRRILPRPGRPASCLLHAWFGVCALGVAAVLVLTKSRGAWVAAGAAIVVLLARRWRWALAALPAAGLGLGLALWRLGPRALFDALAGGPALAPNQDGYGQWLGRVEIWSRAIYMVQDFPYTGAGAGAFGQVADTLYPFLLKGPEAGVTHAHNLFLQVAVDLGLPGLVAYGSLLLLAGWCAIDAARRYREAGENALAALAWAGLAALVAMCVHGMVDATTWIVGRGAFVPWAVIGTILAVHGEGGRRQEAGGKDAGKRLTQG